jgi:sugar phosphate isomerase/epimerase
MKSSPESTTLPASGDSPDAPSPGSRLELEARNLRAFNVTCRLFCVLFVGGILRAAEVNPFFAMNTIAKGPPEVVVPLLKDLGYAGLGGAVGDRAMAEALAQAGLRFFNGYLALQLHAERPAPDDKLRAQIEAMRGHDAALWLAVSRVNRDGRPLPVGAPEGDDIVATQLAAIVDFAATQGVKVSLYPHTGQWFAHFEEALKMANRLNRPTLGVTFNLCHWLKVEGSERDPAPLLKAAGSRLTFVTINGADTGDTQAMTWATLIQPLGEGSYDVGHFLTKLRATGYTGPIGFQGHSIKAPARDVLARTMAAWKRMQPTGR